LPLLVRRETGALQPTGQMERCRPRSHSTGARC
jgi:hypothetical protein